MTGFFLAHIAECLTLQERLSFAQDLGLQIEITEMDAVHLASEVQNLSLISEDSVLIANIVELSRCGVFNYYFYVPRGAKRVAQTLTTSALSLFLDCSFVDYCCLFITLSVLVDLA